MATEAESLTVLASSHLEHLMTRNPQIREIVNYCSAFYL